MNMVKTKQHIEKTKTVRVSAELLERAENASRHASKAANANVPLSSMINSIFEEGLKVIERKQAS